MTRSTHRLMAAAVALVLTAAPALLHGQTPLPTAQDTATPPWVIRNFPKKPTTPTTPSTQAASPAVADSAYIREATGMNVLEVRLGTMAGQRASNSAVKQFAERMVSAHSDMGQQWTSLASQNSLPTNVALNSIQQQQYTALSKLSGAEFDRQYVNAMVEDHDHDAATFQRIGAGAQSSEVKQLAASGARTSQQHLSQAQKLASLVGASAAVATNPSSPSNAANGRRTDNDKGNLADGTLARDVAYDHILEIRLARMAQKRAKNPEVKRFADKVAGDLPKWQGRWTDLASEHGRVEVHPDMGPLHRQRVDRLDKASGKDFDQVYINLVIDELGSMVSQLQGQGHDAKSADIRNAAGDEVSLLRERLNEAKRLDKQVQANGKVNEKSLSEKR